MPLFFTAGPEEALIKSGAFLGEPRITVGGFVIRLPCCQQVQRLDLKVMTLEISSPLVYTKVGVPITVSSIAQVKISREPAVLRAAAGQLLGMTNAEVEAVIRQTLEGHQRAIMGTLTVEEIYMDRAKFAIGVRQMAGEDIEQLGLELVSYTIKDVKDEEGYLEALGKKRTAEVKRDARIGQAEADRDAGIREADAKKQQMASKFSADTQIADAERKFQLQKAAYDREVNTEKAKADLAGELQQAKVMQDIKREELEISVVERKKQIEIEQQEIKRREKELEAQVKRPADAARYRMEQIAEGQRIQTIKAAEAEAEMIRRSGDAEASVILAKGEAEAARMNAKAEAWRKYSEGAYLEMIIERMPEIATALAKPLEKTDRIVVMGGDSGAQGPDRFVRDISSTVAQLPPVIQALTGVDVTDAVKKVLANPAAASSASVPAGRR